MNKQLFFSRVRAMVLGHCVGDALGVPYEFKSREALKAYPATDMVGFMTHNVPPGTWSDDSSLSFCLMEALIQDLSEDELMNLFYEWLVNGYWTPNGKVFDVGNQTRNVILRFKNIDTNRRLDKHDIIFDGEMFFSSTRPLGNGSIMRIHPLAPYLIQESDKDIRLEIIQRNNDLTHDDPLTRTASVILVETIRNILLDHPLETAAQMALITSKYIYYNIIGSYNPDIRNLRSNCKLILNGGKFETNISSSGYVTHTLMAVFWCLKNTTTYRDAVLKAVNLGDDTDTVAAITGGIAGVLYGFDAIPEEWIDQLARKDDIMNLIDRFNEKLDSRI